jgi:hypothetical protein
MAIRTGPFALRMGVALVLLAGNSSRSAGQGLFHRHAAVQECPPPATVRELAKLIDEVDEELYEYGKITVKGPDVWGENRMTQHRAEYEDQMKSQLGKFQLLLNSYQRRADLAALTSATSLGASVTNIRGSENVNITPPTPTGLTNLVPPAGQLLAPQTPLLMPDALTSLALANADAPQGLGLEPTIALDERSRYLYHLQQLRRINIGDDRSDMPGYGLYLVRVPVSVLPGDDSIKGKGASVTFRAKHQLTPDLLANTFRNVVILDTAYALMDIVTREQFASAAGASGSNPAAVPEGREAVPPAPQPVAPNPPASPSPGLGSTYRPTRGSLDRSLQKAGTQDFKVRNSPVSGGNTSGAMGQGPASEVVDLIGASNIDILVNAVKRDQAAWYRHDPSIVSWLLNELAAAHSYMRAEARALNPQFSPEKFEELGEYALRRDYLGLELARNQWFQDLNLNRDRGANMTPFDARRPIDVLAFALIVQSVLVDRQLKEDMLVYAQRKNCLCGDPFQYIFHALYPAPEAQEVFNAYVACKWPVHVFALDPAVEQQNQLDLFSQRSELQLALATAVATGQVSFENATSYARRLEQDLATVALNRTAVGFGAGDTTFGWRFYPRVQTPPTPSNPRRVANLLLMGGEGRNYDLRNRVIEPGPREAYALMVLPNFVPRVRLTSATNWFDLETAHNDQLLETTDMVRLSRKLQVAKAALARLCDARLYRPEETELLADRLDQLEAMLPIQGHEVLLPFEADLTGSELFSSNSSGLAPRLLTWYGEGGPPGQSASVFILGTNFHVHEMKAIVGGVTVPDIDMISRNVIRIDIPDEAQAIQTNAVLPPEAVRAYSLTGKGPHYRYVIDVHVATPNGISNHLFIEVPEPPKGSCDAPKTVKTTVTTKSGLTADGAATTTTTIETTPPGIALPPGTLLPMGINQLPNGPLTLPGAFHGWFNPNTIAPGMTPVIPEVEKDEKREGGQGLAPSDAGADLHPNVKPVVPAGTTPPTARRTVPPPAADHVPDALTPSPAEPPLSTGPGTRDDLPSPLEDPHAANPRLGRRLFSRLGSRGTRPAVESATTVNVPSPRPSATGAPALGSLIDGGKNARRVSRFARR